MVQQICFQSFVHKAIASFSSRDYSNDMDICRLIAVDETTSMQASMHALLGQLIDQYRDHRLSEFNAPMAFYAALLLDISGSMARLKDNSTLRSHIVTVANKVNSVVVDFEGVMGEDFSDTARIVAAVFGLYEKWTLDVHRAHMLAGKLRHDRKLSYGEFSSEVVKRVTYGLGLVDLLLAPLQKLSVQNISSGVDIAPLMSSRIEYLELVKAAVIDQRVNDSLAKHVKEIISVERHVVKHLLIAYQDIIRLLIAR